MCRLANATNEFLAAQTKRKLRLNLPGGYESEPIKFHEKYSTRFVNHTYFVLRKTATDTPKPRAIGRMDMNSVAAS